MLQYIYFVVYDWDVGTMTFEYPGQCHIFISLSFLYIDTFIDWFRRRKSCFFPDNFLLTHNEDRLITIVWTASMYPVHLHTFSRPTIWSHSFMVNFHRTFLSTDNILLQHDWHVLSRKRPEKMLRFLWRCLEEKYLR